MNLTRPALLLILDGWGCSDDTQYNAIAQARTPHWDRLWSQHAHGYINTSGERVGLPDGQMGNSEVGHMNLGSGRVVYQDFTRVTKAISDGSFFENPSLVKGLQEALQAGGRVHILGLLSDGGVHSHILHLQAAVDLAVQQGAEDLFVHAFLDGRDTPPQSALDYIQQMEQHLQMAGKGCIASVCGRYFAMDRDNRWERVERAFRLLTEGEAARSADAAAALVEQAYAAGENDEFVQPGRVHCDSDSRIRDGDVVLFMNFRADRARELTRAFTDPDFDGFPRPGLPKLTDFITLTEYQEGLPATVAYPPLKLDMVLGEYIASLGLKQLRIAETEKYAHVTFFFNGGREEPFEGEDRVLVPSPRVSTYDLQPEMSLPEVTDKLVEAIGSGQYDLIVCNIANGDMVGHTGVWEAALQAAEAVDDALGRITAAVEAAGGVYLITADHGNIEKMRDADTGQPWTAHTTNLVPLICSGPCNLQSGGALEDIAPTILGRMGLPVPEQMTGRDLCKG